MSMDEFSGTWFHQEANKTVIWEAETQSFYSISLNMKEIFLRPHCHHRNSQHKKKHPEVFSGNLVVLEMLDIGKLASLADPRYHTRQPQRK